MKMEDVYSKLPILETDRLSLRKISLDDLYDMHTYCSNEEVARYCTWTKHESLEDTEEFIRLILNKYELDQYALWGIEEKETGTLIGTIDFVSWQPKQQIAEIGYAISQVYWGRGIVTEASKAVIAYGFEEMDLVRIQAKCLIENVGSARVMEKVGMSYEGLIRKGLLVKDTHRDLKMYSILREEFEQII
ncbi:MULTISPECIES: GNAT family protein [unclassified Viridibacillus]|uniref:GNAT family N-acetyltransferase n=1 Tax=unclassified Viridibacillus TaxID=2617942 RepID=UPI00096E8464|nr:MULTISPECIES: GNAT family protein [unclassified Viridibacillus]OMC83427.1 GNAT family N-acetyltransferase [Viridibacillus sp. FSL H8-0123]OMC84416.1 GNAT family N-acetyltransferase [Viridibacillus sp. FSL H7-0596]